MDRRNFFKRIGLVSAGVIITPVVATKTLKEIPAVVCDKGGLMAFIKSGVTYSFNTPENIIEFWRLTGNLVYHKTNPITRTKKEIEELFIPIIKI